MLKVAHIQIFISFCAKLTYLQKDLFGASWFGILGKKEGADAATAFQVKRNSINQCRNNFLTTDEMSIKKLFFGLTLAYTLT